MKSVPLRRRLLYLAAAGILPIALMSGLALLALFDQQRTQAARAGQEIARALSIAIDADIQSSLSALQVLANSTLLDSDDLSGFERALARTMPQQQNWRAALLLDPAGVPVVRTGNRDGGPPPHLVERESFERVLAERRPLIGFLARGPGGDWAVPLRVPVVRDGRVHYVLTAAVKADSIADIVRRQRLPEAWVVTVVDGKGQRIVRLPGQEKLIGTPASATLTHLMASSQNEGMGITETTEGTRVYTAYARAALPGWSVALGVPESVVLAGARRSLATYGAG
ncbi:MAG TPA: cache domain-containing protein, partial [Casimicrobiaceae bacterium]|nr:cache domain-containing protein [Casimicrobiaceae bacterium]